MLSSGTFNFDVYVCGTMCHIESRRQVATSEPGQKPVDQDLVRNQLATLMGRKMPRTWNIKTTGQVCKTGFVTDLRSTCERYAIYAQVWD